MISLAKYKTWAKEDGGAVAVEFAQIIIPFIFIVVAIIELSLFFAAANMLESSVSESARVIRTGQLQNGGGVQEDLFRAEICDRVFVLIDCANVDIEVIAMDDNSFSSVDDLLPVYDADGRMVPRAFDAGGSESVVMIRAAYRYQLMTPLFSRLFSQEPDQTIPLLSTVVLQTEPYDFDEAI